MILGAVLAGGRSRRFGGDKAAAMIDGRAMIDHVVAALSPLVDRVVVCGRAHATLTGLADRPAPGLGPLGGISAALHHAAAHGFDRVLTLPCDTPTISATTLTALLRAERAAVVADCPVIGCWPAELAPALDALLAAGGDRSVRAWARRAGAVALPLPAPANVNYAGDLVDLHQPAEPPGPGHG